MAKKIIALIDAGETYAEAMMFGAIAEEYPVGAHLLEDAELVTFKTRHRFVAVSL